MTNGIIEFQDNIPQELALLYLAGKPIETARGPRVMFSVKGGKKLFVDPPVAEQIAALGAKKGEPISICKREDGFEVKRIAGVPVGAPSAQPASRAPNVVDLPNGTGDYHTALRFYEEAVDLVIAIERYALAHGKDLRASFEDVRCIAATARITAEGR